MLSPFSLNLFSHPYISFSYNCCSLVDLLISSYLLPSSSYFSVFFVYYCSLLAPSYFVLVSNQFVVREMPSIFFAYFSASLYFLFTLIPFSITFILLTTEAMKSFGVETINKTYELINKK
jgi:hypothetical protein